jgi:hypothetical protein
MFNAAVDLTQPHVSVCFVVHYVTSVIMAIREGVASVARLVLCMTMMAFNNVHITKHARVNF